MKRIFIFYSVFLTITFIFGTRPAFAGFRGPESKYTGWGNNIPFVILGVYIAICLFVMFRPHSPIIKAIKKNAIWIMIIFSAVLGSTLNYIMNGISDHFLLDSIGATFWVLVIVGGVSGIVFILTGRWDALTSDDEK